MKTVTFLITVYNKELYLEKVIDALAAQKGDFKREFIFVDDGSWDYSVAIINHHKHKLQNCKVVTQVNGGPAKAINHGISLAKNEFIKFVDGDDVLVPNATKAILAAMQVNNTQVAFGRIGTYNPMEPLNVEEHVINYPAGEVITHCLQKVISGDFSGISSIGMSRGIAARELLAKVQGADGGVFVQDYSISLRLAAAASQFSYVDAVMALQANDNGVNHLSHNTIQERHDTILALSNFANEYPELATKHAKLILRRVRKVVAKIAQTQRQDFIQKYIAYIAVKFCGNISYNALQRECSVELQWIDKKFGTSIKSIIK